MIALPDQLKVYNLTEIQKKLIGFLDTLNGGSIVQYDATASKWKQLFDEGYRKWRKQFRPILTIEESYAISTRGLYRYTTNRRIIEKITLTNIRVSIDRRHYTELKRSYIYNNESETPRLYESERSTFRGLNRFGGDWDNLGLTVGCEDSGLKDVEIRDSIANLFRTNPEASQVATMVLQGYNALEIADEMKIGNRKLNRLLKIANDYIK